MVRPHAKRPFCPEPVTRAQFSWARTEYLGFALLRARSHAPISGVDAGRKPLLGRDLLKERSELFTFGGGQRGAQRFHVLATDAAYLAEHPLAFLGQVQCILSAIIGMRSAFDQPSFLDRIEYRHQTTGMDAESRRQILLADSAGGLQHAQDPGVRRCEIDAGDPLAEPHGGMGAYLGPQEGHWGVSSLHGIWLHFEIV